MEVVESFLTAAATCLKQAHARNRAAELVQRWAAVWQGPTRVLDFTHSNHGACLHFNQFLGTTWCHAFTFHATRKEGFFMKGPDTDRSRKSHKLRTHKLDPGALDALFEAWSLHPEARPAGNAVEFFLDEVPDDTWAILLQEVLHHLADPGAVPPRTRS